MNDPCPSCGNPIEHARAPRKWCASCLPSTGVCGKPEWARRYRRLSTGRQVVAWTGSSLHPIPVCSFDGCDLGVESQGFCARHRDLIVRRPDAKRHPQNATLK